MRRFAGYPFEDGKAFDPVEDRMILGCRQTSTLPQWREQLSTVDLDAGRELPELLDSDPLAIHASVWVAGQRGMPKRRWRSAKESGNEVEAN